MAGGDVLANSLANMGLVIAGAVAAATDDPACRIDDNRSGGHGFVQRGVAGYSKGGLHMGMGKRNIVEDVTGGGREGVVDVFSG